MHFLYLMNSPPCSSRLRWHWLILMRLLDDYVVIWSWCFHRLRMAFWRIVVRTYILSNHFPLSCLMDAGGGLWRITFKGYWLLDFHEQTINTNQEYPRIARVLPNLHHQWKHSRSLWDSIVHFLTASAAAMKPWIIRLGDSSRYEFIQNSPLGHCSVSVNTVVRWSSNSIQCWYDFWASHRISDRVSSMVWPAGLYRS